MSNIPKIIHAVLVSNELGGDTAVAYRFSDADGVGSGRSGYSFGVSQFDIENNWKAIECLRACGFTPKDLKRLYCQDTAIADLNAKLRTAAATVNVFDRDHMAESIQHCRELLAADGILCDEEAFVHLVDYHNQFHMTPSGKIHVWLRRRQGEVTPEQILDFKLTQTIWGQKRPDDVKRRFDNIRRIFAELKEED